MSANTAELLGAEELGFDDCTTPSIRIGFRLHYSTRQAVDTASTTHLAVGALQARIQAALHYIEDFPVSYNRTLLAGSLDYCIRALRRLGNGDHGPYKAIREYTEFALGLIGPYIGRVPDQWARLDFTLLSDRFENLQVLCSGGGVMPRLEDVTLKDIIDR